MTINRSLGLLFVSFVFFCSPLLFVGNPGNPAYPQLKTAGAVPDISIIGDSRAHVGMAPRQLLAELTDQGVPGLTAQNFAVDGTDVLHHWSFASSALLSGPRRPRVLIWAANPLQFDDSRRNNRLEYLKLADALPLLRMRAPLELVLDVVTMGLFRPWARRPLFKTFVSDYSERLGIRTLPLQTRVMGLTYEQEELSRTYTDRGDGWVPFKVLQWKDRFHRGALGYEREYAGLKLGSWHFALVRDFARRCARNGVKLIVVETPVSPWFQSHLALLPVHQEWRRRMADELEKEGALFLNHAALMEEAGDEAFGDPGHMPEDLALRYTKRLGGVLLDGGALGLAPAQTALTGEL